MGVALGMALVAGRAAAEASTVYVREDCYRGSGGTATFLEVRSADAESAWRSHGSGGETLSTFLARCGLPDGAQPGGGTPVTGTTPTGGTPTAMTAPSTDPGTTAPAGAPAAEPTDGTNSRLRIIPLAGQGPEDRPEKAPPPVADRTAPPPKSEKLSSEPGGTPPGERVVTGDEPRRIVGDVGPVTLPPSPAPGTPPAHRGALQPLSGDAPALSLDQVLSSPDDSARFKSGTTTFPWQTVAGRARGAEPAADVDEGAFDAISLRPVAGMPALAPPSDAEGPRDGASPLRADTARPSEGTPREFPWLSAFFLGGGLPTGSAASGTGAPAADSPLLGLLRPGSGGSGSEPIVERSPRTQTEAETAKGKGGKSAARADGFSVPAPAGASLAGTGLAYAKPTAAAGTWSPLGAGRGEAGPRRLGRPAERKAPAGTWETMKASLKRGARALAVHLTSERPRTPIEAGLSTAELEGAFRLPAKLPSMLEWLAESSPESSPGADRACSLLLGALVAWFPMSLTAAFLFWLRRRRAARSAARSRLAEALVIAWTLGFLSAEAGAVEPARGATELTVREAVQLGGSEGYEGGELFEGTLGLARDRIRHAMDAILAGIDHSHLCDLARCSERGDRSSCAPLDGLSAAQRESCTRFVTSFAAKLKELADERQTPFRVSAVPLVVATRSGWKRSVAAITRSEPEAPVIFHLGTLKDLDAGMLTALVVHELGHKIVVAGKPIDDDQAVAGFTDGKALLDAVGASVAAYARTHAPPSQAAPPFPPAVSAERWCAASKDDTDAFLAGLFSDLEGRLPEETELARWREKWATLHRADPEAAPKKLLQEIVPGPRARSVAVTDAFLRFLKRSPRPEELTLSVDRMRRGVGHAAMVSSLFAHKEYRSRRGLTSSGSFVSDAFRETHGRAPGEAELHRWIAFLDRFDASTLAFAWLAGGDGEAAGRRVADEFRRFLNREPTAREVEVARGWLASGSDREGLVIGLLAEPEYRLLQGQRRRGCPERHAGNRRTE